MRIVLNPGRYYAGIDRPFFVTEGMIRSVLDKYGVKRVLFHERDEEAPPVNPALDPHYGDEWDEWVEAIYTGRRKPIDVPRHWEWLVFVPAQTAVRPAPSSPSPRMIPAPGDVLQPIVKRLPDKIPGGANLLIAGIAVDFIIAKIVMSRL